MTSADHLTPKLFLGAAREISARLNGALDDVEATEIRLTRDEALITLALVEAAIEQLAREVKR